ncbi:hypothetical protein Tco_0339169, partial [Tanacetum coccineum]
MDDMVGKRRTRIADMWRRRVVKWSIGGGGMVIKCGGGIQDKLVAFGWLLFLTKLPKWANKWCVFSYVA